MKKTIVTNNKTNEVYSIFQEDFESLEKYQEKIAQAIAGNWWGAPAREIVALSEPYDEADVESTRSEIVGEETITYVTLKADYVAVESDVTAEYERKVRIKAIAANGEKVRNCCDEVRAYIAGYNLDNFTHEEIDALLVTFSSINTALINMRVTTSRDAIAAITPAGAITQELLDDLAYIYTKWGFGA